jgi:hypothetical protein
VTPGNVVARHQNEILSQTERGQYLHVGGHRHRGLTRLSTAKRRPCNARLGQDLVSRLAAPHRHRLADVPKGLRVIGLALLNPWVRSEAGLARARVKHYYRQRLLEPAFWRKLLAGGVGWQTLRSFDSRLRAMQRPAPASASNFQERMAQGWRAFPGRILLLLSERDLTAQEFVEHANSSESWRGWSKKPSLEQQTLPAADHTCSTPGSSALVQRSVLEHLRRFAPRAGPVKA